MSAIKATCICGTRYVVNTGRLIAQPGRLAFTTEPVAAHDVEGNPVGPAKPRTSSRWVNQGPHVPVTVTTGVAHTIYTWTCSYCAAPNKELIPIAQRVECKACRIAEYRANPPADYYVNPRYGASCNCCGFSGYHSVTADGAQPACRRSA